MNRYNQAIIILLGILLATSIFVVGSEVEVYRGPDGVSVSVPMENGSTYTSDESTESQEDMTADHQEKNTHKLVDLDSVGSYEELVEKLNAIPYPGEIPTGDNPRTPAKSEGTVTAEEAHALVTERGFINLPMAVSFDISGNYKEIEAVEEDGTRYPSFKMQYVSAKNVLWLIYVIDGNITAVPLGDSQSYIPREIILSERPRVTQYDASRNQYSDFTVEACEAQGVLCVQVPRVNKDTLDHLSTEDIKKLG